MDSDTDRKRLAVFLGIGGLVAAGFAFQQARSAEFEDRVAQYSRAMGAPSSGGDRTIMWILIGVSALLFLGALITWLSVGRSTSQATPTLTPGWYDDPESPQRLRYWDGARWTDNTAEKESG